MFPYGDKIIIITIVDDCHILFEYKYADEVDEILREHVKGFSLVVPTVISRMSMSGSIAMTTIPGIKVLSNDEL